MIDDGGISMSIGGGAVGLVLGFVIQLVRTRITSGGTVDLSTCSDHRGANERDHRDLFHRMAIVERDLAASRATQEAMRVTVERMDRKLDRILERQDRPQRGQD